MQKEHFVYAEHNSVYNKISIKYVIINKIIFLLFKNKKS